MGQFPAAAGLPSRTAAAAAGVPSQAGTEKARKTAQDFEAVFLNSMFQQMFASVAGEGPFGGGAGVGVWRSFLTEQYSRSFAKAGGIGIGNEVYRALIAQQETSSR
jgi:Rod binding domain-containing protein